MCFLASPQVQGLAPFHQSAHISIGVIRLSYRGSKPAYTGLAQIDHAASLAPLQQRLNSIKSGIYSGGVSWHSRIVHKAANTNRLLQRFSGLGNQKPRALSSSGKKHQSSTKRLVPLGPIEQQLDQGLFVFGLKSFGYILIGDLRRHLVLLCCTRNNLAVEPGKGRCNAVLAELAAAPKWALTSVIERFRLRRKKHDIPLGPCDNRVNAIAGHL